MLQAIRILREMEELLESLIKEKQIKDFRASYFLNGGIDVYVLLDSLKEKEIIKLFQTKFPNIEYSLQFIDEFSLEEDYKDLFQTQEKILFRSKRSLRNAFRPITEAQDSSPTVPKIIFYSYKGGVGRTTTLCAYAIYLASQFKYKVLIVDCDLEAPGVTNFFSNYITNEVQGGLVEYLLDSVVLKTPMDLKNYSLEISRDITKEGQIFVVPAGNLFQEEYDHLRDYIEGLSRVSFFYGDYVTKSFQNFLDKLYEQFSPDVILFDSRTGFHDMAFYLMAHHSNLNVCFFGATEQNLPGLQYVLKRNIQDGLPLFLVNSILPVTTRKERFEEFQTKVNEIIQANLEDSQSKPAINTYPISYDERLHNIGIENLEMEDLFIQMILHDRTSLNQYEALFKEINHFLGIPKTLRVISIQNFIPHGDKKTQDLQVTISEILSELLQIIPDIYADTTKATDEFLEKFFYVRSCFIEILNLTHNKFLCIGSKGSGKTAIYKAMQNHRYIQNFFDTQKVSILPMASVMETQQDLIKYKTSDLISKFTKEGKNIENVNWKNFWMIYTWNAINVYNKQIKTELKFELPQTKELIHDFSSKNTQSNTEFFFYKLEDSQYLKEIEKNFNSLDNILTDKKSNLILIYDQIDFIVEPIHWDLIVSPLIELFRIRRFQSIHPRLFLRRDLYNRLGRLTNKNNLTQNFSISLEWSKEEIFAMFFKIVWNSKKLQQYFKTQLPEETMQEIQANSKYNQIPHTSYEILKQLVRVFFGEYAGKQPSWGISYNWFYFNLKNADDTISVRPFLDLIREALKLSKNANWSGPPVLPWHYY
ncbi:MAG: AAA family ATPase, partial [Leptospiraceae bacterium]|nr:AAA family ATPase [Leptospiraceae bacterium]